MTVIFIDGKFKEPEDCPKSDHGHCPECGTPLDGGYGYAGGYGLGSYNFCPDHFGIYDFVEDTEGLEKKEGRWK